MQPDFQIIKDLFCLRLPQCDTHIWRRSARLLLDRIELRDALDGLVGDGRALCAVDVDELAPDMRHACDFMDIAGTIEILEPGIPIGMHPSFILCEMVLWVLPFAIWRELIPAGGRFVESDIKKIFRHRHDRVEELLGDSSSGLSSSAEQR